MSWQGHTDDPNRFGPWVSSDRFAQKVIYIGQIDIDFKLSLVELCNPACFPRVIVAGLDQRSKDCLYYLASWFSISISIAVLQDLFLRMRINEVAAAGCEVDQIAFCYF